MGKTRFQLTLTSVEISFMPEREFDEDSPISKLENPSPMNEIGPESGKPPLNRGFPDHGSRFSISRCENPR